MSIIDKSSFKGRTNRIFEIDFFRGIAIIMMIYYHFIFDLNEFAGFEINLHSIFYKWFTLVGAILFISISGIASNFSKNNLRRGMKVFGLGIVITIVSLFMPQDLWIQFGILHFFGLSMIISHFILNSNFFSEAEISNPLPLLVLGNIAIAFIILNYVVGRIDVSHNYFLIFGIISPNFESGDYYPMIPWFGLFLFGIIIGKLLYKEDSKTYVIEALAKRLGIRNLNGRNLNGSNLNGSNLNGSNSIGSNLICNIGKNSLLFYLLHQPILIGLILIVKKILIY